MIVADSSLVFHLLVDGPQTAAARRIWQVDPEWVLPPLWRAELLEALVDFVGSGRITLDQALPLWIEATDLFRYGEREPRGEKVLLTASRLGIPAFDAHYVVVAQDLRIPLVTDDPRVLQACPGIARSIVDFGGVH